MAIQITKRLFTVDEYHCMAEAGILKDNDRVELIEGEIIDMAPIGVHHARCVDRLTMLLTSRVAQAAIVRIQSSVRLSEHSEPQPDVTLLAMRDYSHDNNHPGPSDILLLIEVSDTTLAYDKADKLPLYARARIPEFWLVNLKENTIEVYSNPVGDTYKTTTSVNKDDTLALPGFPGVTLNAQEILP